MRIASPTPVSSTSDNSNGSDGYFSEVFDQELIMEEVSQIKLALLLVLMKL